MAGSGRARLRRSRLRAGKLAQILQVPEYRRALRFGVGAAVEHDSANFRTEPRTVIDVGANRGQFALVAMRRWPSARLICFEPLQEPARTLRRLLGSAPNRSVIEAAVSEDPGSATFHVSRSDDSSSLLAMTELQTTLFPDTDEARTIEVSTVRLDDALAGDALDPPVLLKLDVQGGELGALRGAAGLLPRVDALIVECSFVELYEHQGLVDDVIRFLHQHSFRLEAVRNPEIDERGALVQADLAFGR